MEGSGEPPMKLADRGDLLSRETKGDEGGEVGRSSGLGREEARVGRGGRWPQGQGRWRGGAMLSLRGNGRDRKSLLYLGFSMKGALRGHSCANIMV
jgi:hypothetical protein